MSQEQRDSYVIPPNFIEGGSFFGGLFKARNVVEAVILAAGTGIPILTLSLTLTVRIILLLSLIHISEPTRQAEISYAVFCLKKKKGAGTNQCPVYYTHL